MEELALQKNQKCLLVKKILKNLVSASNKLAAKIGKRVRITMSSLSLFLITPLWGFISPWLFFNGWLSFLGMMASLFFLIRRNISRRQFICRFFNMLTSMLFFFALLLVGFYIFSHHLSLGFSPTETVVFTIFATGQMCLLVPNLSVRINKILDCNHSLQNK